MSKKVTKEQLAKALENTTDFLWELFQSIDDTHRLYDDISCVLDLNSDILNKYHGVDPHLGCHNWPNCDEFGCGEAGEG